MTEWVKIGEIIMWDPIAGFNGRGWVPWSPNGMLRNLRPPVGGSAWDDGASIWDGGQSPWDRYLPPGPSPGPLGGNRAGPPTPRSEAVAPAKGSL